MSEQMFKAFDNKNKEWVEHFYVSSNGNIYIDDSYNLGETFALSEIKATLCRSTKKTIKEKMLFQFDIVRCFSHFEVAKKIYNYHVCEWSEKYSQFFMRNIENNNLELSDGNLPLWVYFDSSDGYEIIGNIFANKNLLEVKE